MRARGIAVLIVTAFAAGPPRFTVDMLRGVSDGVVPFVDEAVAPAVRAMLHVPTHVATGDALVLAHGAGSDREAPVLVAVAAAFAARGLAVLRCDLPFRQARRHGPPARDSGPRDRAG